MPHSTRDLLIRRGPWLVVALAVVVGALVRLYAAAAGASSLNADEAVTGLMARSILHGGQAVFFTGQNYNGSFEQYLQAGMYAVFRLPEEPFTLRLVQVLLTACVVVAIYAAGRAVFRSPWVAALAAVISAAGPFFSVLLGTRSFGAYDSTQLACVLAVLCVLRATGYRAGEHVATGAALAGGGRPPVSWRTAAWWLGFGLCLGFIAWAGLSGIEVVLVPIVWAIPTVVRAMRSLLAVLVGFVAGALPVIVWIVEHHRFPDAGGRQPPTTFLERARILRQFVGPEFLGLRGPTDALVPTTVANAVIALIVVIVATAFVVNRRGLVDVVTFRTTSRRPFDLILWTLPCAVLVYLASTHTWYAGGPRYLFVAYPMAALATAGLVGWLVAQPRLRALRPIVIGLTAVGVVATLAVTVSTIGPAATDTRTTDAMLRSADRYLLSRHVDDVYSGYWTAVPLMYFDATGRIRAANWNAEPGKTGDAHAVVDRSTRFVYVTSQRAPTLEGPQLRQALQRYHVRYTTKTFGSVTIYQDLSPLLRPDQMGLSPVGADNVTAANARP